MFGIWAALTFAGLMAVSRDRNPDAVGAAAILFISWCVGLSAHHLSTPPGSLVWSQTLDAFFAVALILSIRDNGLAPWKIGVAAFLGLQAYAQFAYQADPYANGALTKVATIINVSYAGQLLCLLQTGVSDAISNHRERGSHLASHSAALRDRRDPLPAPDS